MPQTNPIHRRNLAVTEVPIDTIVPYANNARKHPRSQIDKLAESLKHYGWTNPLLVGSDRTLVCGHGRLEAAKRLGFTHVPVITLEDMSDADRRAYVLADNVLADKSGWSKKLLASELQGLIALGFDVELTGLDTIEVDRLLGIELDEPEGNERVELPGDAPPISRVGDLWQFGLHRIYCGDARDPDSYARLLQGELAQLVFTDPPYGCAIAGNVSGLGRHKHRDFIMGAGETSDAEFAQSILRPALSCLAANSAPGAIAFVCMDWRSAPLLHEAARGLFRELKNHIVWVKTNAGMGSCYRSQHEFILMYKVSAGKYINNFGLGEGGRHRSNVWTYAGANTFRRGRMEDLADHPTVKPKKLVEDALLDCSKRNGAVLDCFAGAGTTLAAAAATGRRGFGIELDPRYVDVIVRRMEAETGLSATLDTGETFAQVAQARAAEA